MLKRTLLNLVLLFFVVALALFIWLQPFSGQQQAPKRLFELAPYEAELILIQRKDAPDIKLQKLDGAWQLVLPGRAPVNQERIKQLLTVLEEPIIASYDLEGKALSEFGLDPGKISLTINTEQATFGATNPVTLNRYILKDKKIYTIKEIVYGVLGSSVVNLLKHDLLPESSKVVSVSAPALFQPLDTDFWTDIKAIDIADYSGDETIIGKITLELSDQSSTELDILAIKPALVFGRSDLRVKYTFDEKATSQLMTEGSAATKPEQ